MSLLFSHEIYQITDQTILKQQIDLIKTLIQQNKQNEIIYKIINFTYIDELILLDKKEQLKTNDNILFDFDDCFIKTLYKLCLKHQLNDILDLLKYEIIIDQQVILYAYEHNNLLHLDLYKTLFPRYIECLQLCFYVVNNNTLSIYEYRFNELDLIIIFCDIDFNIIEHKYKYKILKYFFDNGFRDYGLRLYMKLRNKLISISYIDQLLCVQLYIEYNHKISFDINLIHMFQRIYFAQDKYNLNQLNIKIWFNYIWTYHMEIQVDYILYNDIVNYIFQQTSIKHLFCDDIKNKLVDLICYKDDEININIKNNLRTKYYCY